jgi:hypothetical protein
MVFKVKNAETQGVLMRASDYHIAAKEARRQADRLRPALITVTVGRQLEDREDEHVLSSFQATAAHAP